MKHIYLIGFMGSGKTTVAKQLSNKLNKEYLDIDEEVEKIQNKKISRIFKEEGEEAFREYETKTLKNIGTTPIISTGGGIVEKEKNVQWMKNTGIMIYLKTSYDLIQKRLQNDSTRPLWQGNVQNQALYVKRTTMYETCTDYIINCDKFSLDEIIDEIIKIYRYKGRLEGEK